MEHAAQPPVAFAGAQGFLQRVFRWMVFGLVVTAAVAAIVGVIFELYTAESIFTTFLIAAVMFGSLALYGALTKRELTGLGPILFGR